MTEPAHQEEKRELLRPPEAEPPRIARPEDESARKLRQRRSIFIALGLVLFILLIYLATIFRLGANVLNRPI